MDRVIQVQGRGRTGDLGIILDNPLSPGQFIVKAPGVPNRYTGASGTGGADATLRTDLASAGGSSNIGFTPENGVTRSLRQKASDIIDVRDYGAVADGVTDNVPAFRKAMANARKGRRIKVPNLPGSFFLSANPDPVNLIFVDGIPHNVREKHVIWDVEIGAKFSGPGFGLPTDEIKFLSPITNPYNQVFGESIVFDMTDQITLNGGALIGNLWELAEDFGYRYDVTGDLSNGSAVITNVSASLLGKIKRGDRIESQVPGWPQPGTPFMRVWDVSDNSITIGVDLSAGPGGPTPWAGENVSGGTFSVFDKAWYGVLQIGMTTGGSNSRDHAIGGINGVVNLTGAPANFMEIDIIALSSTFGLPSRGLFFTGHGDQPAIMYAIDIQRAGPSPWTAGVSMRNVDTGVYINGSKPIVIDVEYANSWTGATEPILHGVHFTNAPVNRGALLEGRIVRPGGQGLVLWAPFADNNNANTRFWQCMNETNDKEIAFMDGRGGLHVTTLQLDQTLDANNEIVLYGAGGQKIMIKGRIG
jgi:hypothetical protein